MKQIFSCREYVVLYKVHHFRSRIDVGMEVQLLGDATSLPLVLGWLDSFSLSSFYFSIFKLCRDCQRNSNIAANQTDAVVIV